MQVGSTGPWLRGSGGIVGTCRATGAEAEFAPKQDSRQVTGPAGQVM